MREIMSRVCNISDKSYYVWRKKSHIKLIMLIEKYFSKDDLEEFLETGTIQELDDYKSKFKASEEYSLFKEFIEFKKHKRSGN